MRRPNGFTLVELLVVVGIIGMLASMLVPSIRMAIALTEANVCMGRLKGVGTALQIYRQQNDHRWPWIDHVTSDWSKTPTGTNRDKALPPEKADPGPRALTALLFLLVRDGHPAGLFVCPADAEAAEDTDTRWDHDGDADTPMDYYRDFAGAANVSFSLQAPVKKGDRYVSGLSDTDSAAVLVADKSPAADDPSWRPVALTADAPRGVLRESLTRNHPMIGAVNVLRAGLDVMQAKRPDIGIDHDHIYTASGRPQVGAREGTSLDLSQHLSVRDSFLLGPVRDANQP